MHHNKEYEEKWGDGLVKGVKVSATAGVSRCMFTLYEDGVYGIRNSSSCETLGRLLVYSELKFWLIAESFGLDQKVLDGFEELFVVQISLTIMCPLAKE